MDASLEALKSHVGRTMRVDDVITASSIGQLAAVFGIDPPARAPGDPIPVGWHVAFFVPLFGPDRMRADGQMAGGGFMPDVALPLQRLRGDSYAFRAPLAIGDAASRHSEITGVEIESTAAGPVVTIVQRHSIEGPRGISVIEDREFFYHGMTPPPPAAAPDLPAEAVWHKMIDPTAVLLFRYSAVRFNSHRVHYDRDFSVREEGLPGLIVPGTLIAQLLLELARTNLSQRAIASFAYRIQRPIFDTGPFEINGAPDEDGRAVVLWAVDPEGDVAMTATAELR